MYAGLGLSAVTFVVHGLVLHGWEVQNRRMSLVWMGLMALFNFTGAGAYAARVRVPVCFPIMQLCAMCLNKLRRLSVEIES